MKKLLKTFSYDNYDIYKVLENDKMLYLGSKYNMKKYVEEIRKNIKNTSPLQQIVVFGSGNGTWLDDLDIETQGKQILVVEPEQEVFNTFISRKHNVKKNSVEALCMGNDDFYNDLLSCVNNSKIKVLIFANYDFVYQSHFDKFIDSIRKCIIDNEVRDNTQSAYAKIWFENYLKNLPHILSEDYVNKYENLFKGKSAIIVSAGPSLDKNLKYLKNNEGKFIIICVGRALKALKEENIKVDFTAIIDGTEQMYNVFKESLDDNTPLLFNEQSNNKIIQEYKGKKIFFATREMYEADKIILDSDPIVLFQGGSVSHSCIDFARILGCEKIVFIGQDLAYTNQQTHSNRSISEFENNKFEGKTDYYVKGIYEEKVKTNFDLDIFRQRIEMMIKLYPEIEFINSTEGGAHIEGTFEKKLITVIEEHEKYELIDKSILEKQHKMNTERNNVISNLKKVYDEIDELIILCKKAYTVNNTLMDNYLRSRGKYNKAIDELDSIDNQIREKKYITYIFDTLINVIDKEIIKQFGDKQSSNNITENIKLISDKGKYLNSKLIEMFEYGKPLIKECIDNLEAE